ncbi:hypothetical protein Tco_1218798 [Tanacetum coccineum]
MRQKRWIDLFSDYECTIRYHPGKVNVVADALSRKERVKPRRVRATAVTLQSGVKEMILAAKSEAFKQENVLAERLHGLDQQMERKRDESLYFMDRIWVLLVEIVMDEVHVSSERMIQTLEDKMRACVIDIGGSYHLSIRCAPFEAFYGRKCRSPILWAEIGESSLIGPELVQEMTDKVVLVKEKPKAARDRQKSYAKKRSKLLEFEVGDRVLLKVTPWKGIVHFGKKGKLAPGYVGPFEILKRIDLIKVDKTLRFVEEPVEIMDREIKKLKRRKIVLVKVRWNLKRGPEFTW